MYKGKATIYNLVEKEIDGISMTEWEEVASIVACHLSFKSAKHANQTATVSKVDKEVTLFINTGLEVAKGSKVEIEQHGAIYTFYATGESSIYPTHQEIGLVSEVNA